MIKKINIDHKTGLKQVPGARNLMIFGPIACFRRLESRFSGQKGPRSSEMRVYIEITGHIKNHQNFKNLSWSRESKKRIFTIFPEIFTRKIRNTGISSETTIPGISSETIDGHLSEWRALVNLSQPTHGRPTWARPAHKINPINPLGWMV